MTKNKRNSFSRYSNRRKTKDNKSKERNKTRNKTRKKTRNKTRKKTRNKRRIMKGGSQARIPTAPTTAAMESVFDFFGRRELWRHITGEDELPFDEAHPILEVERQLFEALDSAPDASLDYLHDLARSSAARLAEFVEVFFRRRAAQREADASPADASPAGNEAQLVGAQLVGALGPFLLIYQFGSRVGVESGGSGSYRDMRTGETGTFDPSETVTELPVHLWTDLPLGKGSERRWIGAIEENIIRFQHFEVSLDERQILEFFQFICSEVSLYSIGKGSTLLSGAKDKAKRALKDVVVRSAAAVDSSSVGSKSIAESIEMFSYLIGLFKVIVEVENFYIIYLDYFSYKRYFKLLELKEGADTLIDNILFDRLIDFMVINFPEEYQKLKSGTAKICGVDLDVIRRNSIEINCIRGGNDVRIELKYRPLLLKHEPHKVLTLAELTLPTSAA